MKELRPAHEVIVEKVLTHSRNLKGVSAAIAAGGVESGGGFISVSDLASGSLQEIGGLASQCKTLTSIIIPEEKIPWVIEKLREADAMARHSVITGAIEELESRAPAKELTFSGQM